MANSKRMIQDLHDMAGKTEIPTEAYRSLTISALADLIDKVEKLETCFRDSSEEQEKCLITLEEEIKYIKTNMKVNSKELRELSQNSMVRLGVLWDQYPWVIKTLVTALIALIALGGVQSLVNFIHTIF